MLLGRMFLLVHLFFFLPSSRVEGSWLVTYGSPHSLGDIGPSSFQVAFERSREAEAGGQEGEDEQPAGSRSLVPIGGAIFRADPQKNLALPLDALASSE